MRVVDTPTGSVDVSGFSGGVTLDVDEQYSEAPGMANIHLTPEQAVALAVALLNQVILVTTAAVEGNTT